MNKKDYIRKYYGKCWLNKPGRNEEFKYYALAHDSMNFDDIKSCFSIGIGDAIPLEKYYSEYCEVFGVDMSEECVSRANLLDNITAIVSDITDYTIGKYDLIVALRCLFFIDDWKSTILRATYSAQKYLLFDIINQDNKWISDIELKNKKPIGRALIKIKDLIKIMLLKKERIQSYRDDILHSHYEIIDLFRKIPNIKNIKFYGITTQKFYKIDHDKDYRIIYLIEKE